jgi:hypothetical protein
MIGTLFSLEWKRSMRYFGKERLARFSVALVFFVLALLIGVGIYTLFERGLIYINSFSYARDALSLYVYELIFFVVGMLMCASALITGLLRLYRGEYDSWVMASQSFEILPPYLCFENFITSLWPLLLIGVPTLLAMYHVYNVSLALFCLALLSLISLGVFTVVIAFDILLIIGILFSVLRFSRIYIKLAYAIAGLFLVGAGVFWAVLHTLSDLTDLFPGLETLTPKISVISIEHLFNALPSHPVAEAFYAAQQGSFSDGVFFLLGTILFAIGAVSLFLLLARTHLTSWQRMQEGSFNATRFARVPHRAELFKQKDALGVLFRKEVLLFFRNQRDLLWLGFLSLLWVLQVYFDVIIRRTSHNYSAHVGDISSWIQALQVLIIVYFISMFVLRFVFPAFSVERQESWIIGSIPIRLQSLYEAKVVFFGCLFVDLAIIVAVLHSLLLGLSLSIAVTLIALVACMAGVLTILGLSIGVLFPNFETSDPEILSTSMPGLACITLSLVYGCIGAFVFKYFLTSGDLFPVLYFLSVSALIAAGLLTLSLRKLEHYSFELA